MSIRRAGGTLHEALISASQAAARGCRRAGPSAHLVAGHGRGPTGPRRPPGPRPGPGLRPRRDRGRRVGPDGWIYISPTGSPAPSSKVNPCTGVTRLVTSGLPTQVIPLGGAMDIAFRDHTAYVLVTLVSPDVGGTSVGRHLPHRRTALPDRGRGHRRVHPGPSTHHGLLRSPVACSSALTPYRSGFLVTDGHHNRVLYVTTSGAVSEVETFSDIVPTGITKWHGRVYMTEAGPVPHLPEDGRVIRPAATGPPSATEVASGARLAVDVAHADHALVRAVAR